jgi:hypothetical protein
MQNKAKTDEAWGKDYNNGLSSNLDPYLQGWLPRNLNSGLMLSGIPGVNNQRLNYIENYWRTTLNDSLFYFHGLARQKASGQPSSSGGNHARFVLGTYEFDTAFQNTKSTYNTQGGSRIYDMSALYHIAAVNCEAYCQFFM